MLALKILNKSLLRHRVVALEGGGGVTRHTTPPAQNVENIIGEAIMSNVTKIFLLAGTRIMAHDSPWSYIIHLITNPFSY